MEVAPLAEAEQVQQAQCYRPLAALAEQAEPWLRRRQRATDKHLPSRLVGPERTPLPPHGPQAYGPATAPRRVLGQSAPCPF